MRGQTGEHTSQRRVIPMEMEFHTLHNVLHYLYTNQIVLHSKPGKETGNALRTVDVQRLHEAADQLLLFDLREKASNFLCRSHDIQNITARVFGHFARTHEDIYNSYRNFFCARLPAIVQTEKFDDFFHQIEDADPINTQFRDLVQTAFSCTDLVSLPTKPTNVGTAGKEQEEEDDDSDSADADYVPSDDEYQEDQDGMEIDNDEDLETEEDSDSEDSMNSTNEDSSGDE
jgi:hypothetical protein